MQRQLNCLKRIACWICIVITCSTFIAEGSYTAKNNSFHLYVARFMKGDILIIDSATHREIGKIEMGFGSNPVEIIPSPDYKFLYVANRGFDEIAVIDAKKRTVKSKIKVGLHPNFMKISPDGKYLIVANNQDKYASVIDLSSNTVIGKPQIGEGSSGVAVTPDNRFAYITSVYTDDMSVIDLQKMERISILEEPRGPIAIVIPPNSPLAYFGSHRDSISILDTRTNQIIGRIMVGDTPSYITLSIDGKLAFVPNYWSHTVSVIDLEKDSVITEIKVGREPIHSVISPDGRLLFVVNYGDGELDGSISIIDVEGLKKIDKIKSLSYPRAIAVVP